MVEQQIGSSMKVYELAKELGVDSISLLDRLASLNIKVKNHMSDLGEEELKLARESLVNGGKKSTKAAPAKAAGTKTVARKKKAASPETEAKAVAAPEPQPAPAGATTTPPSAAGSSTIIRRRAKSDESGATLSTSPSTSPKAGALERESESHSHSHYSEDGAAETYSLESGVDSEDRQDQTTGTYDDTRMSGAPNEEILSTAEGEEHSSGEDAALYADSAVTGEDVSPDQKRTPIVLPPRPSAPRKSFLKIVDHTPVVKPRIISQAPPITPAGSGGAPSFGPRISMGGGIQMNSTRAAAGGIPPGGAAAGFRGSSQQDKDGFRVIRMTKENLDQMAEDEKKGVKGAKGLEGEIKPEDVRFADYRKKEVVFLPRRKKIPVGKELRRTEKTVAAAHKRVVEMGDTITVSELASQMSAKATDVVRKLMMMGTMANMNQSIDFETATLVAAEFKHEVKNVAFKETEVLQGKTDAEADLINRPPVVTIMGHVDHGKTSLLDAIRQANVAKGEAGGITQHIGAYTVQQNDKLITFIDTPGHAAFTAMRARGANVTDIVILVVAADDGVMPQTREALSHAKAAGVPIIVAMNKIDKPGANPEKIKQQLAELDLLAEDWGGQTIFSPVSAKTQVGIPELLESILLQAEVLDLKANPTARAEGSVIEARLEKGRGPVATVLVKRGTLKVGEYITSGVFSGKVKALTNHLGASIKSVSPGMAAEVLGFEGLPSAGEKFDCVEDDSAAKKLIDSRRLRVLQEKQSQQRVSLTDLFAKAQSGHLKELGVILKGDVSGSVEAVRDSVLKLSNDQVKIKVLFSAPGGITESDVMLATASNAVIIGFNVRPETKARQLAEAEHIEIKCYNIIYELIDDIKNSMAGLLDKKKVEKFLGRAEVRQTFSVPKLGLIAGSAVIDGKVIRGANVRLLRDSRIIFEGKMSSLRRFKDDAKEVAEGFECGIGIENFNDIKIGDLIEAYEITLVTPELNPATNP
jgi:translation initiation factor IF-2